MERKKIEVGKAYGVVRRRSKRARMEAVKATVVSLDAEHEVFVGSYSSRKAKRLDGIRVRFDEPMIGSWDGWRPDDGRGRRSPMEREPVTEFVLADARLVVAPWEEIAAEKDEAARLKREDEEAIDEIADKIEPRVALVREILKRRGLTMTDDRWKTTKDDVRVDVLERRGTERHRVVDAEFEFTLEAVEKLLGDD